MLWSKTAPIRSCRGAGTALAALAVLVALLPAHPGGRTGSRCRLGHLARRQLPRRSHPDRAGHDGTHRGTALRPIPSSWPPTATRSRSCSPSGTTTAFKADAMPSDGKWTITPTTTAAYKPGSWCADRPIPRRFNGTVIVEWMNVSGGESAPDWDFLNPMLIRDGYAYVRGLGAGPGRRRRARSLVGLPGGSGGSGGLVNEEPARYGSLHHPGDQYSLDMFAQIGEALRARHPARWEACSQSTSWPSGSPSPPST